MRSMNYSIILSSTFKRSIRRLKRRYPRVQDDMSEAITVLQKSPRLGVVIPHSNGVRKMRVRNRDAQRGKSGGYRLIYYVVDEPQERLTLLFAYSKSDRSDITQAELQTFLEELDSM